MWVIFFQNTPHFWLIGGETYRVGKKDCHVVIQDDRSISRTHLTITLGSGAVGSAAADASHGRSTQYTPQSITLTDTSTYGTSITSAGEEEGEEEAQGSGTVRGASAGHTASAAATVLDTGIIGLRYASSSLARSNSDKKSASPSNLPLTKGLPYNVPVNRAAWRQFSIQLGHHGAALRLVWVDVSVLCEDVDVEVQTKLEHALRYCGVRQGTAADAASPHTPATTPSDTLANTSLLQQPQGQLSRNTLSERSAEGVGASVVGAGPFPAVLGSSGVLSLSQRTSVSGTASLTGPSMVAPPRTANVLACGAPGPAAACYGNVDFLVTSTVQPSTAVVGMLCRAVPIVTPAFFSAIRDRASPQLPLPDPRQFIPPPSTWWCDLIQHARQTIPDAPATAAVHQKKEFDKAEISDAAPPSSLPMTQASFSSSNKRVADGADALPSRQMSEYFAPNPLRRALFKGSTFVVVQRVLYEEVLSYLDCTGATVVWEGGVGEWVTANPTASQSPLSFSPQGFSALQSFFARHQRHIFLYNATEEMPFDACLPVLHDALGLCSVEYGVLIESIIVAHPPPLADYPDSARLPQTVEEVLACVRLARGEASLTQDSDTQDSELNAVMMDDEATEGRRTDAQPLFPDVVAEEPYAMRKGARVGGEGLLHADVQPPKRSRREDAEGWVTLGKPSAVAMQGGPATAKATCAPQAGTTAVRTVDIHCSPCALPPYPCFADVPATATAGASAGSATAANGSERRKGFVKQVLPPAEPLAELEQHRGRRQLAASMLVARVPTVDADSVVPEQVVMGGGALNSRATELRNAAFNTFDTVVHNASSRRRGTTARRGRGGARANQPTARPPATTRPSNARIATAAGGGAAVVDVDDVEEVSEVGPRAGTESNTFQIFEIDGIF